MMLKKASKKLFIVNKMIWATSLKDALKKEKITPVHECWMDSDFKKAMIDYKDTNNV